ncbi:hypothetical protein SCUCBS95973_007581 [Sporothrix curviconia]|uniref:Uncharacterized protein n=1 Tax=Sporothrix curviconia TaxID=1260050 RepID=A0ABP0CEH6_9PEZI
MLEILFWIILALAIVSGAILWTIRTSLKPVYFVKRQFYDMEGNCYEITMCMDEPSDILA